MRLPCTCTCPCTYPVALLALLVLQTAFTGTISCSRTLATASRSASVAAHHDDICLLCCGSDMVPLKGVASPCGTQGIKNYKLIFWSLRFHGSIFFSKLYVEVKRIWQPPTEDNVIKMRYAMGAPCGM